MLLKKMKIKELKEALERELSYHSCMLEDLERVENLIFKKQFTKAEKSFKLLIEGED